jgi:hypothetical protein
MDVAAGGRGEPQGAELALTPLWLPDFILEPGVPGVVRFAVTSGAALPTQLTFRGQDYRAAVPDGGWPAVAPVSSNGTASLALTHSTGYYEYRCDQTNQSFGVVAAPRLAKPLDDRFAVLAGFTQICNTAPVAMREPLLAMLARIGVRHYRDFPQAGQLRPNASSQAYDWDNVDPAGLAGRMEQLHELDRKYDLRVMDCFGGALGWNQRSDWYDGKGAPWRWPKDLSVTADTFEAIALHWGDTQGGVEADNEMDAAPYTADQYSVLLKAMRYGLYSACSSSGGARCATLPPLVCGAFTDAVHSAYLDLLGRNQVFEVCDAISYHTYSDPATVQDDIGRVRLWQEQWNGSKTPLYITESGADFALRWNSTDAKGNPHGLPRPSLAQGRAYAFGNIAHQIENIAVGVDRTFAFNYLYYAEGGLNYGLTGAAHTPLRVLAAYATAVRFLQHKRYIGDIPNKVSPNGRGRVFANRDLSEIVACVFAGSWSQDEFAGEVRPETPPGPMWSWFMPITGAYEADGSVVDYNCAPASGCQWGNYDKLSWLTLNASVLSFLDRPTIASALQRFGSNDGRAPQPKAAPPPVILQMVYDNKTTGVLPHEGSSTSYSLPNGAAASAHSLTINVNNMAKVAGSVLVTCTVAGSSAQQQTRTVTVPARSVASATFTLDITTAVEASKRNCDVTDPSFSWGVAVVDVSATAAAGGWGNDGAVAGAADWEERLSMNFMTV